MSEDVWFHLWQTQLLRMANTDFGRELLCIEKRPFPVVFFRKNCVRYYLGRWDGRDHFLSDYRIGAKWANVIRTRFDAFQSYSRYFLNDPVQVSPLTRYARSLVCTVTTTFPQPDPETTTFDGYARRTTNASFSTMRGANGENAGDTAAIATIANIDDASDNTNFSEIRRTMYLFDTSSIPDGDTISAATFSIYGFNKADPLGCTPDLDIVQAVTASNTAASTSDYQNMGSTVFGSVTYAGYNTSAYNDIALDSNGIANVSKTGVSKFGARMDNDTDNIAPSIVSNGAEDSTTFEGYHADQGGTSNDPKLTVTHATPASTRHLPLLGIGI